MSTTIQFSRKDFHLILVDSDDSTEAALYGYPWFIHLNHSHPQIILVGGDQNGHSVNK